MRKWHRSSPWISSVSGLWLDTGSSGEIWRWFFVPVDFYEIPNTLHMTVQFLSQHLDIRDPQHRNIPGVMICRPFPQTMILHERRNTIEAIGVVKHRGVVVDSPRDPLVSGICCLLLLAEVGNDDGELVMLGQMSERCVVVSVADIENEEDAASPLLDCEEFVVDQWAGHSEEVVLLQESGG